MDKTFNELFNEFFKRNNIKPEDKLKDNDKYNAKQLIELLSRGGDSSPFSEDQEKEIDEQLGKPDKIEFFNEGDTFFERCIWYTKKGEIQKLSFSKDPTLIIAPKPIDLQKKLDEAVINEEFEKACHLRDLIKKSKKVIKKTK